MPELLLELGCEELPASFVRKAFLDLETAITSRLTEAGIEFEVSQSMGTPRRLIIQVTGLPDRQPDSSKRVRGPALAAAFDPSDAPTKALGGFCRGQGVELGSIEKEGGHVWANVFMPGKSMPEVLAIIMPESIRSLTFDKAMRWGSLRTRFARPIRWILACFDGDVVSFELDGIQSGLLSRGHRFNYPEPFEAKGFDLLVNELRAREVEPDPSEREKRVRTEAARVAEGSPQLTEDLVAENVYLTEWPAAVSGRFREEFLELPATVLVTAMAKHEKFFPVRNPLGELTNEFVSIRNGGADKVVAEGNAWVLNARFNDAKFFFDEDSHLSMEDFLEKTKGIVFQDKLGTIHQRAYRLRETATEVAKATQATAVETDVAGSAGLYAKADLSSGLVSELPALQGQVGAEYGLRDGFSELTCKVIAAQYGAVPEVINDEISRATARLIVADQLDKLAGYLGIGHMPSGSSDPFGLRRAANLLIEVALRWPEPFPDYALLFEEAMEAYIDQGFDFSPPVTQLTELFRSRYASVFADERRDVVEAALLNDYIGQPEELRPQRVQYRIGVLKSLVDDTPFVQTATRPQNIVTSAVNKGIGFVFHEPLQGVDAKALDSKEGEELLKMARSTSPAVALATSLKDTESLVRHLRKLTDPINLFFDKTMVMAEDEAARSARLTLLHGVNLLLREAGDFSKIVVAG
jgi:glycyl-tRNA synthetase beta chain